MVTTVTSTKTVEPIEMLFGLLILVNQRNNVWVQISHKKGKFGDTCLPMQWRCAVAVASAVDADIQRTQRTSPFASAMLAMRFVAKSLWTILFKFLSTSWKQRTTCRLVECAVEKFCHSLTAATLFSRVNGSAVCLLSQLYCNCRRV